MITQYKLKCVKLIVYICTNEFPVRHQNVVLETISENYFRSVLPLSWFIDKPTDYGVDLLVTPVITNQVVGLNFSVQLKAQHNAGEKLVTRIKKSTLNYLFSRLEPAMIILYDHNSKEGHWKWLLTRDFDLSRSVSTYAVHFEPNQALSSINWDEVVGFVQHIFKIKNQLLSALEYDLFQNASEQETKAWAHYFSRQLTEASFYFKRLVEQSQLKSIWFLALAQCQYQMYDYRTALLNINKALAIDYDDNYLLTKGCILAEDGIKNNEARKLHEAEKIFAELYTRIPNATHAYNYANTLSKLKKLTEAEQLYKEALRLKPDYVEVWKNLGQVYYDLHKHKEEMACYEKALAINPNLKEAKISKAVTAGLIYKRYASSIKTMLECIDDNERLLTEFPLVFYWLGLFSYRLSKINDALLWIGKGLNNDPGDLWLLNLKVNILFEALTSQPELIDNAVAFFANNYQVDSKDAMNFYFLCASLDNQCKREEAVEMANEWIAMQPVVQVVAAPLRNKLSFDDTVLLIKHWNIVQSYGVHYAIEKVSLNLSYSGLPNTEPLLQWLQIKRMLLIAQAVDVLEDKKIKAKNEKPASVYKTSFLTFDPDVIAALITCLPENKERFAKQFSETTVTLTDLCAEEFSRCIGFAVGHRNNKKERQLLLNASGKEIYTETLLYFVDLFYSYFSLPRE